jgi:hypothetical protein
VISGHAPLSFGTPSSVPHVVTAVRLEGHLYDQPRAFVAGARMLGMVQAGLPRYSMRCCCGKFLRAGEPADAASKIFVAAGGLPAHPDVKASLASERTHVAASKSPEGLENFVVGVYRFRDKRVNYAAVKLDRAY